MAEGGPPSAELTSISFRDQMWLNAFPLDRSLVFDYFALSPFYDRSCNNEQLRMRSIHPLDMPNLQKMLGIEYILHEAQEPHLFVFRKQKRDGPEKATPFAVYYVLDGSIYQSPQLYNVMGSRVARSLYHVTKAFSIAAAKLEKIGYSAGGSEAKQDKKAGEEEPAKVVDVTEVVRIDQILGGVLRKLPPAPPPPAVPAKVGAPLLTDTTQPQQAVDPVTGKPIPLEVQGAAKRIKLEKV